MTVVLGINAVFHDPAAADVVDGRIVVAAAEEEERFSRRKHGKDCNPFSTWELPERAIRVCLVRAGAEVSDIDAIAYSYDPALTAPTRVTHWTGTAAHFSLSEDDPSVKHPDSSVLTHDPGSIMFACEEEKIAATLARDAATLARDDWEPLRTLCATRAPYSLRTLLPGLDLARVRFVPHHVAHAASAHLAEPPLSAAVLLLDRRGERVSYVAATAYEGGMHVLASQGLPHSLGLLYEEATQHLGFRRSSRTAEPPHASCASAATSRGLPASGGARVSGRPGALRRRARGRAVVLPARVGGPRGRSARARSSGRRDVAGRVRLRGRASGCRRHVWPSRRGAGGRAVRRRHGERASERRLAMEVVEAAGRTEAPSWAGRLDVGGRAALVRDADRMVSGDTGIAHLATAARTPSVILFGPMPPALWGPPPERPMHRALHRAGRGDPHGTEVDPRQLAIEVDEVVEAARIGLAMRPARPPAQTAARLPSEGAEAS